ncbi:conserved exported hypothetical protein [Candidatus Desulfosporosinus infrequens]|uniref:Uncharacterized protein n=1 Tax=Candidatus Desulfosporosinus infrequens TaxID=2043169 RepID=A0A2U3LE04_9FIRM|nr:conserved exported hypothetical protein [Candidatus Desulfosporosinus infrequens]
MHSFSSFVFSCRMQLSRLKRRKFVVCLSVLLIVVIIVFVPSVYQESWLDPFSTLNVPNRELHPLAITKLGMVNSEDPFHPYYYINTGKIHELMRDLQHATPLSSTDQTLVPLENQKVLYFTLHRELSHYHTTEDYALQYYPAKSIVRFGQQEFRINESTVYAFTQITGSMTTGWWK